ncbi:hypothetical protein KKE78_05385 [Patescibacteria group bacterium]|nr:hypothetical protein [Patescibacteria group bacterium]
MKIVYTKHALEKFVEQEKEGWKVTKTKIRQIIKKPEWKGITRYDQETAIGLMDEKHILRIVLDRKDDIIKVITFHLRRRGKYESTL